MSVVVSPVFFRSDIQHLEANVVCFPVSLVEKGSKNLQVSDKVLPLNNNNNNG